MRRRPEPDSTRAGPCLAARPVVRNWSAPPRTPPNLDPSLDLDPDLYRLVSSGSRRAVCLLLDSRPLANLNGFQTTRKG